ncbi:hypothetical protein ACFE04_003801 [Oxalis oulophora]
MGGSKNWLKSLITNKKPTPNDQDPKAKNKWKLWRSGSEGWGSFYSTNDDRRGHVAPSETSDFSSSVLVNTEAFTAAMATMMRARPKDFLAVKQEWAAIRIQTVFRAFLARQALRALRAVVRIQAIFRGRQVRKQAAVTLRCMQALVRVQERMRLQSTKIASDEENKQNSQTDPIKQAEQSWCNSPGTVDEVRAKIKTRHEGVMKRERAIAYSRSQNQSRTCPSPIRRVDRVKSTGKNHKLDKSNNVSLEWVERWMAAKPWESRLVAEECSTDPSEISAPYSRKSDNHISSYYSKTSEHESVNVRRNNVTTKISARPPCSSTGPSTNSPYDDRSTSNSSTSLSPIPKSTSNLVSECLEMCDQKPTYMNLTRSTKNKLRAYQHSSNLQSHRNSSSSNPSSAKLCKDLYPPVPLGRRDMNRNWPSKDNYRDDYLV